MEVVTWRPGQVPQRRYVPPLAEISQPGHDVRALVQSLIYPAGDLQTNKNMDLSIMNPI